MKTVQVSQEEFKLASQLLQVSADNVKAQIDDVGALDLAISVLRSNVMVMCCYLVKSMRDGEVPRERAKEMLGDMLNAIGGIKDEDIIRYVYEKSNVNTIMG